MGVRFDKIQSKLTMHDHNDLYHTKPILASTGANDGASLIGIEDAAGKYTATTVEGALAEGTTEGENDGRYIRRANDDGSLTPGYEKSSSVDGITADYISDKTLHNVALKGHPGTKQAGSIWFDTTVTPNRFRAYHDGAEKVIMTDLTMQNDRLQHLPDEFVIDIMSGNSDQLGANGLPLIQGYGVSVGAYPVPLLIDGGEF